jgi:hypothetical protein
MTRYISVVAVSDNAGEELRAALAARQELGPEFEPAIVESFLDRLHRTIEARVDAQVSARLADDKPAKAKQGSTAEQAFASMFGGVLATGVIGLTMHSDGLPAVFLVWIVVAVINVAYALAGRPRSSRR